jgi:ribonuclease R
MLPKNLSNGICSLNAGVDRLAMSCIMLVSPQGDVLEHEIAETVINVDKRMTYEAVREVLEGGEALEAPEFTPLFFLMEELAAILRQNRRKRGAIDFEFPESKILVDAEGVPYDVMAARSNTATRIIEEFMILCNETVAGHFYHLKSPFIYRSHDNPEPDKIEQLKVSLGNFGFKMGGSRAKKASAGKRKGKDKNREKRWLNKAEKIYPRDIQRLLKQAAGTPYEATISRLALRSMKRAEYSAENTSHFGLASPCYCHFTSPIRRYPDLQIHRIIKEHLRGKFTKERYNHYAGLLTEVAKQSSERERRAEETEREVDKLKKAEYMEQHLGEIFEGVISGITSWGFYVELENTIEGLVHISSIKGDYFIYEEETMRLVGRNHGLSYRLGQPVKIWVKAADKLSRLIDFELA